MPEKPLVFISHITEEKDLASIIKDDVIETHLLGAVDVFVSSDSRVNSGGQSWLKNIEGALQNASVYLILTSPNSIQRPWINIEAGAGWVRQLMAYSGGQSEIFVMPLCHSGQKVSTLPKPWDTLNAVESNTVSGLQEILNIVGKVAGLTRIPKPNFDDTIQKIITCENYYSRYSKVEQAIKSIIEIFPQFKPVFLGQIPQGQLMFMRDLPQYELNNLARQIQFLNTAGLLTVQQGGVQQIVGGPKSGTWVELGLNVTPKYVSEILGKISI